MKAMIIRAFGGPEVFEPADLPVPVPGPTELLVRVHATSVNPVDYKIRRAGAWANVHPPAVIGYDVSGVVEAAGIAVRDFAPGDEVYYTPEIFRGSGSYAEYHVADESIVARKPATLNHLEAAAIPLAGGTAWDGIVTRGRVALGETVLIHAGAGGVGSFAVQIAKAAGARVIATVASRNHDIVRALGADVVIDYRAEDFVAATLAATGGQGVDLAFDTVGGDTLARSIGCTCPFGRLVSIVNTTGGLDPAYLKNLTVHFAFLLRERGRLDKLRTLVERGQLKPLIDSVLPLSAVADAHRRIEAGGMRGKIVLEADD